MIKWDSRRGQTLIWIVIVLGFLYFLGVGVMMFTASK